VRGASAHRAAEASSSAPKQAGVREQGCARARAANGRGGRAQVVFDPGLAGARDLVEAVRGLGFEVALVPADDLTSGMAGRARERRFWLRKFLAALVFSARGPAARRRRSRRPAWGTILWRLVALRPGRRAQINCRPLGGSADARGHARAGAHLPAGNGVRLHPGARAGARRGRGLLHRERDRAVGAVHARAGAPPSARATLALCACKGPWTCSVLSCRHIDIYGVSAACSQLMAGTPDVQSARHEPGCMSRRRCSAPPEPGWQSAVPVAQTAARAPRAVCDRLELPRGRGARAAARRGQHGRPGLARHQRGVRVLRALRRAPARALPAGAALYTLNLTHNPRLRRAGARVASPEAGSRAGGGRRARTARRASAS
jgi:hypothetical protein